eukprot:2056557-Heterocapsa_arctica.AAC.1
MAVYAPAWKSEEKRGSKEAERVRRSQATPHGRGEDWKGRDGPQGETYADSQGSWAQSVHTHTQYAGN